MAALRTAITRAPAQQCQRCFSNGAIQAKLGRSNAVAMNNARARLPITQKRTKYSTVEQAKSRHSTGVCKFPPHEPNRTEPRSTDKTNSVTTIAFFVEGRIPLRRDLRSADLVL